jgi:hypothetical protein
MNKNMPDNFDRLDDATAQRLRRLGSMPVDTSRLDKLIQAQIPRPQKHSPFVFALRPIRAIAASVLILVMVGVIVLSLSGGAVLASPDTMAQLHQDMISGKVAATQVDSIDQANKALEDQWHHSVQIPQIPADHAMKCCIREIDNKRVACVLLNAGSGKFVTMAVAPAKDMKCPDSESMVKDNIRYHIQKSGQLNMVMAERDGLWICLISDLDAPQLMSMASEIKL